MTKSPALIRITDAGSGTDALSVLSAQDELARAVNPPPNVMLAAVNISPVFSGSVHGFTSPELTIETPAKGVTPRTPLKLPGVDGRESLSNNAWPAESVRSMLRAVMRLNMIADASVLVSVQVPPKVYPAVTVRSKPADPGEMAMTEPHSAATNVALLMTPPKRVAVTVPPIRSVAGEKLLMVAAGAAEAIIMLKIQMRMFVASSQ